MSTHRFHVVPMGDAWTLRREGATRTLTRYRSPAEATDAARRRWGGACEVIVHDREPQRDARAQRRGLDALAAAFGVTRVPGGEAAS
ncbi:MAG: DUF2188 domain-containing protein [Deltaproteobacteria bacterium]|nr:DUF2188 domain-containing protein [Deltaproteobacteria bacterium]